MEAQDLVYAHSILNMEGSNFFRYKNDVHVEDCTFFSTGAMGKSC